MKLIKALVILVLILFSYDVSCRRTNKKHQSCLYYQVDTDMLSKCKSTCKQQFKNLYRSKEISCSLNIYMCECNKNEWYIANNGKSFKKAPSGSKTLYPKIRSTLKKIS